MARRRGRSGLSDEDRKLWGQVARSITPMSPADRRKGELPPAAARGPVPPAPASGGKTTAQPRAVAFPADFRVGQSAPPPDHRPGAPVVRAAPKPPAQAPTMDARTHRALTRGKLRPEARIDLHGMTLATAKIALTGFIMSAQAAGHRLVLVITGKGKGDHGPLPVRSGALRHEVPHWLNMAPVASAVMQVVPAHFRHGGGGAYYVYLRRRGGGRN